MARCRYNGKFNVTVADELGWPGRLVRHKLLDAVLAGTPLLLALQVILVKRAPTKSAKSFRNP